MTLRESLTAADRIFLCFVLIMVALIAIVLVMG